MVQISVPPMSPAFPLGDGAFTMCTTPPPPIPYPPPGGGRLELQPIRLWLIALGWYGCALRSCLSSDATLSQGHRSKKSYSCPGDSGQLYSTMRISQTQIPRRLIQAYSVETGSSRPSRAECSVCHDKVAHLTRAGNSETPDRISRSPTFSISKSIPGPRVIIW